MRAFKFLIIALLLFISTPQISAFNISLDLEEDSIESVTPDFKQATVVIAATIKEDPGRLTYTDSKTDSLYVTKYASIYTRTSYSESTERQYFSRICSKSIDYIEPIYRPKSYISIELKLFSTRICWPASIS